MDRFYLNQKSNNVTQFIGTEVERSPAHGKTTLFVVGLQPILDIEETLNSRTDIEHIYFGANQSFPLIRTNDFENWSRWENMIIHFIEQGYLCTLDVNHSCVEGLLESALCESDNFIPMISVKLPYLQQLGYNATIKFDDKDFQATNPGVWCHSLHSLLDRRNFTHWSMYRKDQIIK